MCDTLGRLNLAGSTPAYALGGKTFSISKLLEAASAAKPRIGYLYARLLYRRLVAQEALSARIGPGAEVLHIGCGSLPATAIYLAQMGCKVTAVDRDPACAQTAREVIKRYGLSDRVWIAASDGKEVDASEFDAVWVSVQVRPKELILRRLLSQLKDGAALIYRNPRGLARSIYAAEAIVEPDVFGESHSFTRLAQPISKESVVVSRTPGATERDGEGGSPPGLITLDEMALGSQGVLVDLPPHSLLPPLGLRIGKPLRVQTKQRFGGPVVVDIQGRTVAIGRGWAREIYVRNGVPHEES